MASTQLSDSIYNLFKYYLPAELRETIDTTEITMYIEKWQLYIQPLVNHEIPLEEYKNEDYYEALENQLVMELAAYDWLLIYISNGVKAASNAATQSMSGSSSGETTGTSIPKKIVTGPAEVEFFGSTVDSSSVASILKAASTGLQPGGFIDTLKSNICMLAGRLDIWLPICERDNNPVTPPTVQRRHPHR